MDAAPAITSETGALQLLESALGYLAAADPAQMPAVIQAQALTVLERADARATAARAQILAAFTASQGYCDDGDYSACSWLMHSPEGLDAGPQPRRDHHRVEPGPVQSAAQPQPARPRRVTHPVLLRVSAIETECGAGDGVASARPIAVLAR